MASALLMGVDIGTSSSKTVIIDQDGRLLSHAAQEYRFDTPRAGWAEQQPEVWVAAALASMQDAVARADVSPEQIAAIGLSGQMHGTVCLDREGHVVRPAVIWPDQRSSEQVAWVYRKLGRERLAEWTGNPLATGFMLPTWLWLREHEPETRERTANLSLPKDYVRHRLISGTGAGALASEPSDASSTLLFDTARRRWNATLLDTLEIVSTLLPAVHESATLAGGLSGEVATATRLRRGTPVVYGASDQAAQALGNGIIRPGVVACTIGTGGQLFAPTAEPVYDPGLRVHLFCHALPGFWHLLAATLSAGLSLRWLRDQVFEFKSYQALAEMAEAVTPGAEGLFFLPYLAGERTPHMDAGATGAFIGLTLRHRREHMVRAVMEGVVMSLRQGLELIMALGARVERVVASGGGTRHRLWLQLQADIFDRPIYQTETIEAAAVGAALLAGVGAGVYPDIQAACDRTVRWRGQVIHPVEENVARYAEAYATFCWLYPALRAT